QAESHRQQKQRHEQNQHHQASYGPLPSLYIAFARLFHGPAAPDLLSGATKAQPATRLARPARLASLAAHASMGPVEERRPAESRRMTAQPDKEKLGPVTIFGPDFPFPFDDGIKHPAGLGSIPADKHGAEVAIIGAGISGLVSAYELMKLGLRPVVYEASQMGGRLRPQPFAGAKGVGAELGGGGVPHSSSGFFPHVEKVGLQTPPRPHPPTQ